MASEIPANKVKDNISAMKQAIARVDSGTNAIVASINKLSTDFKDIIFAGMLNEVEQFRSLEVHILEGTANEGVLKDILLKIVEIRSETSTKVLPLAKRLEALTSLSKSTDAATTESTENNHD